MDTEERAAFTAAAEPVGIRTRVPRSRSPVGVVIRKSRAPRIAVSVTIHTGSGNDDRNDLFQDSDEYIWNNDGDTATLRNDKGNRVDRCRYPGGGDGSTAC